MLKILLPCAVDVLGNTAADISLSFNDAECYTLVRDAGVRTGRHSLSLAIANEVANAYCYAPLQRFCSASSPTKPRCKTRETIT